MMLIQGFDGKLNLCVSLNDIDDSELNLLQKIKLYIEKNTCSTKRFNLDLTNMFEAKTNPDTYLDTITQCCTELVSLNPNKYEYHCLYAVSLNATIKTHGTPKEVNSSYNKSIKSLRDKHYSIAYELDNYHPSYLMKENTIYAKYNESYGLYGIYGIQKYLNLSKLNWFQQMELNFRDPNYRKKYDLIIDETECKWVTWYACFILPYIQQKDRLTSAMATTDYFNRYCCILQRIKLTIKSNNYLFIKNHLNYCLNFIHQFRLFGEFQKAVDAVNVYIYFDPNYDHLLENAQFLYQWSHVIMIVDTMLCAGKTSQCSEFIKQLIFKCSSYPYFNLNLHNLLCRIYSENISFGFSDANQFVELMKIARQNYNWNGITPFSVHYYTDICMYYLRIRKDKNINLTMINGYICHILNAMHERLEVYERPAFFGESCFMLAFIYQKYIKNRKCAATWR
eukprot:41773_1